MNDLEGLVRCARRTAVWIALASTVVGGAALAAQSPSRTEAAGSAHWAFQPLVGTRPDLPKVSDPAWAAHPVDAFIHARLEAEGLEPAPRAPREALVRRLYFDLIGLPPSPAQVRAFVEDREPRAYERLVDELLASPHYGEKQARAWLDVVRYAETNSFERDAAKPFVWRYRDWVVNAFNTDKPFDRFVLEQIAGDELPDASPETHIATGLHRLGAWDDEPADPLQARYDELDDVVTTVSQGFLGLTINCARCHDHKLDPIPQRDYYRLLAVFSNLRRYGKRSPQSVAENSLHVISSAEERAEHAEALASYRERRKALQQQLTAIEDLVKPDFAPVEHEEFKHRNRRIDLIAKRVGRTIDGTPIGAQHVADYRTTLEKLRRLEQDAPGKLAEALVVKELGAEPAPTHVLRRGSPRAPGECVEPGVPEVLGGDALREATNEAKASSGRRSAFAHWLVRPEHPLTWRVAVNRIWQGRFGAGIVRTPNDFGLAGDRPAHPELLDWLAHEFVASGFSVKHIHRLLLTSKTWQQDFARDPRAATVDPENRLLGHREPQRLAAEEIRDSILAVSGQLDLRLGGPSIYPVIADEVLAGQSRPGEGWHVSNPANRNRRSLYVHQKRSLVLPILAVFDMADSDFTCPVRFPTTQPTQALSMLNSAFSIEQATAFANRLRNEADDEPSVRVRAALEHALSRPARESEVLRGVAFLEEMQARHGMSASDALTRFCLVTLNLNEFLYVR